MTVRSRLALGILVLSVLAAYAQTSVADEPASGWAPAAEAVSGRRPLTAREIILTQAQDSPADNAPGGATDAVSPLTAAPPAQVQPRTPRVRSRRSIRLARAPNMFGDFFGTARGSILGTIMGPGSTDGILGEMTFPAFTRLPGGTAFTIPQGVSGTGSIPNVNDISFTTTDPLNVNTLEGVPPDSPFPLGPAELQQMDELFNSPSAQAQYLAEIALIEEGVFGDGSFVSAELLTQSEGTMVLDQNATSQFFATFPFVVQSLVQQQVAIDVPTPATGGAVVGRLKIAENSSAVPQDRVFFNYSYFDNVAMSPGGVNVNRFVPGFEKTFFDRQASVEVRVPMATTLSSDIDLNGVTNTGESEFGNLWLTGKVVLTESDTFLLSGGLTVTIPTADDLNFRFGTMDFIRVENQSAHVMPFLGGLYTPDDRFFAMGFLQFDFDTNGNPVLMDVTGNGLEHVGTINDVTYLFADVSVGYWMYRDRSGSSFVTGFAPTFELHYNRSLTSTDVLKVGNSQVGNFTDNIELLNAVIGATVQLGPNREIGLAYATPIGGGSDQQFDGEFRATLNWYFGQSRGGRFSSFR